MKVRIDKPCFIEAEGPFTIIPIYQAKQAPPITNGMFDPEAERIPPVPKSVKHAKPKRKSPRGKRATCYYCLSGYITHNSRRRFCTDAHRHAYMRVMGIKYPLNADDRKTLDERLYNGEPVRLAGV